MSKVTRFHPDRDLAAAGGGAEEQDDSGLLSGVQALSGAPREAAAQQPMAEQSGAAQAALLSSLAHELRTPLASILLNAQLLRTGGALDQAALERISDSIERAVRLQARLIERLSDMACNDDAVAQPAADRARAGVAHTPPVRVRSLDRPGKVNQYSGLKGVRILYIDDDYRTREAVLEVLELTGAHVALAASTADGMMALDTFKPHVILCDLAMPGEDGYAFVRKLRAREGNRAAPIPVLALTGLASVEDKRQALASGFQMHLAKPIDVDRLRDSVLQLVGLIGGPSGAGAPGEPAKSRVP